MRQSMTYEYALDIPRHGDKPSWPSCCHRSAWLEPLS